MATTERNSLAELAKRLEKHLFVASNTRTITDEGVSDIDRAQRIVAELARMKPDQFACGCFKRLIENCRAIAEEGETNV